MTMQSPNLDDRNFTDLINAAKQRIKQHCPDWNDLSPGDPGIALLEAFAFLTETMIYRLNRIPEKAYIEFLNLIGVKLTPPSAAQVRLIFSLEKAQKQPIEIKRGTRITTANNANAQDAPVFTVTETVSIAVGELNVSAQAYHCDYVEAELLGTSNGAAGLSLNVKHAPIIAPTADKLDLIVGVETPDDQLETHAAAIKHNNKTYRIWREVENFSQQGEHAYVFVCDRHSGSITFAPALQNLEASGALQNTAEALAAIPQAACQIRAWYRYGGGNTGNVLAHTLTVLKDPIAGVTVTNPEPASGGRASETLKNALLRGPQELHSLSRAITARDFELLAKQSSGAVNRAKAFTQAKLWQHATPGTVEVTLVPEISISPAELHKVNAALLTTHHTEPKREQIQAALDKRRPLGTHCVVNWANYKKVSIKARAIIRPEEDAQQVEQRVLSKLYASICPTSLDHTDAPAWPFGQSLKAWDVYKIIGSEPAIQSVEAMQMIVDDVPEKSIKDICLDSFQPNTWYTGCDQRVFRSGNNGKSWELLNQFPEQQILAVKSFPKNACHSVEHAGLLAVVTSAGKKTSYIHISRDCGQTWVKLQHSQQLQFQVEDFAWLDRNGLPYILLATENGLYELSLQDTAIPSPILVDNQLPKLGFRAICVSASSGGATYVALAAYADKGVYLSAQGGKAGSYENVGLSGELIEVLAVQHKGPHRYVWAGIAAPGSDQGKGCFRLALSNTSIKSKDWQAYFKNWQAGGCKSLAFQGALVLAASYRLGVLRLDSDLRDPSWQNLNASECGLPLRDVGKLHTVDAVSAGDHSSIIMAGGILGIYLSNDAGAHYALCSQKEFKQQVSIPDNWLLYSGSHEIEISSAHESSSD